jgi:hypothetical protein
MNRVLGLSLAALLPVGVLVAIVASRPAPSQRLSAQKLAVKYGFRTSDPAALLKR